MSNEMIRELASSQKTRNPSWETDFETNHVTFANNLASGIAKEIIEKLGNYLKDQNRIPNEQGRIYSRISLNITDCDTARDILLLTKGQEPLAPFKEWLDKFLDEKTLLEIRPDTDYVYTKMDIIGPLVKKKLEDFLFQLKEHHDHQDNELDFNISWNPMLASENSSWKGAVIKVELEFKEKLIIEEIQTPLKPTLSLNSLRCNKRSVGIGIMCALFIAAIIACIFTFEISKSRQK